MSNVTFNKTIVTSALCAMIQADLDKGALGYETMIHLAESGDVDNTACDMQALMNPEAGMDMSDCKASMEFAVSVTSQHLAELAIRASSDKEAKVLLEKIPAYYALFTGRKGVVDQLNKPNFKDELAIIFGDKKVVKDCSEVSKVTLATVLSGIVDLIGTVKK